MDNQNPNTNTPPETPQPQPQPIPSVSQPTPLQPSPPAPAATPQPVSPPPQINLEPAPSAAQPVVADFTPVSFNESQASKPKSHLKWLFIIPGVIVFLIIVFGILLAVDGSLRENLFNTKLTSYSYNNGNNQDYTLTYFRGSVVGKVPSSGTNYNYLVSPTTSTTVLPVMFRVNTTPAIQVPDKTYTDDANCKGAAIAFSVKVTAANTNVNVCSLRNSGKDIADYGVYKFNNNVYAFTILQKYDASRLKTDPAYARQVVAQANLAPLNPDLKTIVASINGQ